MKHIWKQDSHGLWNIPALHLHGYKEPFMEESTDFKRVQELAGQMVEVRKALKMPVSTFEKVIIEITKLVQYQHNA